MVAEYLNDHWGGIDVEYLGEVPSGETKKGRDT